jgi:nifR3 family TIM-barrel protein
VLNLGALALSSPFGLAPMAGLTDTAFRRLVKRQGGCGIVVTEMVSAEGLVRGQDRTLEYAEFTEEERPVAIQIFGADPERMAAAAAIVESIGADAVDVNMGCPVAKIARGNAGCRLMQEPARAAAIVTAMTHAVRMPVTVKMRSGWDDTSIVAPDFAQRMADAGAAAVTVHGRTGSQAYRGASDWDVIARVARTVRIPVFGNGDCVEAAQVVGRLRESGVAGVLVGRGVVRNPWLLAQAADVAAGRTARTVTSAERARFLLEYIDLLLGETAAEPEGFRHEAPRAGRQARVARGSRRRVRSGAEAAVSGRERWVIGKVRALAAWYTKGLEGGSQIRAAINRAEAIGQIRDTLQRFFAESAGPEPAGRSVEDAHLRV